MVAQRHRETELLTETRTLLRGGSVANWRESEGELEIIPRCQDVRGAGCAATGKKRKMNHWQRRPWQLKESLQVETPGTSRSVYRANKVAGAWEEDLLVYLTSGFASLDLLAEAQGLPLPGVAPRRTRLTPRVPILLTTLQPPTRASNGNTLPLAGCPAAVRSPPDYSRSRGVARIPRIRLSGCLTTDSSGLRRRDSAQHRCMQGGTSRTAARL